MSFLPRRPDRRAKRLRDAIERLKVLDADLYLESAGVARVIGRPEKEARRALARGELPPPIRARHLVLWRVSALLKHFQGLLDKATRRLEREREDRRIAREMTADHMAKHEQRMQEVRGLSAEQRVALRDTVEEKHRRWFDEDDLPSRIEHNWNPDEMSKEDFVEGERFFFEQELLLSHLECNMTIQCLDQVETQGT